ncbi:penicillin acylase family protein [Paenalcaligenes hominis]|uniref:penicillin acylase family protein n=1 Tax=Paenalcaligenes hominis TaxID=643674 RepID=UPI0036194EC5
MYAADTYGVFYGYGYAIATDRLFQMEMAKRTGWGTVAEVLGPDYLETDKATHSRFDPRIFSVKFKPCLQKITLFFQATQRL